jgi:hypothetical protein
MRASSRPGTGLLCLVTSGLLWGTGGLTGSLLSRVTGLSALSVAACRLTVGGVLIVAFLILTGRRWPAGRAAWIRIAVVGALAAAYQSCYFIAVSLTSVALATLVTIGTAPVIVLGVHRVTGHRTGRLAPMAACLALTGLGLLVGLPSGFSETAVLASAGMAVLAAAGFAALFAGSARLPIAVDDLGVQHRRGGVGALQDVRHHALLDGGQGERDVRDVDAGVVQSDHLAQGDFQDLLGHRRERDVPRGAPVAADVRLPRFPGRRGDGGPPLALAPVTAAAPGSSQARRERTAGIRPRPARSPLPVPDRLVGLDQGVRSEGRLDPGADGVQVDADRGQRVPVHAAE